MATATLRAESAPIKLPPVLAFIMGAPVAPRSAVERTIERAIEALDTIDGDPDLEPDGDETDGNGAEDDVCAWFAFDRGPGCAVADAGISDSGALQEAHGADAPIPIRGGGSGDY